MIDSSDFKQYQGFSIQIITQPANLQTDLKYIVIRLQTGFQKTFPVYLPHVVDRRHVIHQGHAYANTMYGIPPMEAFWSFVNGLGSSRSSNMKVGEIGSIPFEERNGYNDIVMKTAYGDSLESDGNIDYFNLDEWHYCRASDIMKQALISAIYEIIDNGVTYNVYNALPLRRVVSVCLHLFRWIAHNSVVKEFHIDDLASTVLIPELFRNREDIDAITCSILDFSDCSQKSTFNRFSLKKDVYLNEIESFKLKDSASNLQVGEVFPGVHRREETSSTTINAQLSDAPIF